MEFKEFSNPEEMDYDINSSSDNSDENVEQEANPYVEQLLNLIGLLEDVTDEEIQEQYGISIDEYYNPTQETINKVSEKLNGKQR